MDEEDIIPREDLHRFVVSCMVVCGADEEDAKVLAELLVTADYRGHYSHGLNRLDVYTSEVQHGVALGGGKQPSIIKQTPATALVDGNNLLGPVVGKFAMDLAIEKAKKVGIGMVSARGSNHYGIAGWYSIRACEQGLLGISMTNTSPIVVPTRSKSCSIGTNPISLAAPAKNGDSFVLDMATSAVAYGKTEVHHRKGIPLPTGWGVDANGKETTNVKELKGLLPLGGLEENGGYKGYGLAMMVEVLSGILAGGTLAPFIRAWKTYEAPANLAQCFWAIDPNVFEDGFEDRLSSLLDHCRDLGPVDAASKVLVAGDPERAHMKLCDELGGIPYHQNQMEFLNRMALELKVDPLKPIGKRS